MEAPEVCTQAHTTCTSVTAQYADVRVPLQVQPYAVVGAPITECCAAPVVTLRQCPGDGCGCELLITQAVCIKIPIAYGAKACAGDVTASCRPQACCDSAAAPCHAPAFRELRI